MNLDELERLYEQATQGEWKVTNYGDENHPIYCVDFPNKDAAICSDVGGIEPNSFTQNDCDKTNIEFIAALHNAFPYLLALARDGERYRWALEIGPFGGDLYVYGTEKDEIDSAIDAAMKERT